MKVRELIAQLEQFEEELEVYQSSDAEGNSHRLVATAQKTYGYIGNLEFDVVHIDEQDMKEFPQSYEGVDSAVIIWPEW